MHSWGDTARSASTIASLTPSKVVADTRRSHALTLLHSFSIGFRSGLYGGKYHRSASAASIASRTPATLCDRRLSITTTSPGRSDGTRNCSTYPRNIAPSIGPSITSVASSITLLLRRALTIVIVFQWPWGVRSTQRVPAGERP